FHTLTNSNHFHSTHLNIDKLIKENKALKNENIVLKNENDLLKSQILAMKKELNTYKNPEICDLQKKTFSFAKLLTNKESWQQLQELNKETERLAEEKNRKKK
ncbi:16674_t:CDS:2, partial [Dentiscutata heterogama]